MRGRVFGDDDSAWTEWNPHDRRFGLAARFPAVGARRDDGLSRERAARVDSGGGVRRLAEMRDGVAQPGWNCEIAARKGLEEFLKFLDRESSVANDSTHRVCVYWIRTWNCQQPFAVGHHDMFTLRRTRKPAFSSARIAFR